ncbi:MAG: MBL fold metallo-hydrolase [Halioglobus sp.]
MHTKILAVLLAFVYSNLTMAAAPGISPLHEVAAKSASVLGVHSWIHGSDDCSTNSDLAFDVYAHDKTTYILRQNKCITFEAPFIYVLVGLDEVLVLDTGAAEESSDISFYNILGATLGQDVMDSKIIVVVHSHSHSDHYGGDAQFNDKNQVTLVKPNAEAIKEFFDFEHWPNGEARVELGGRTLIVMHTPGHQEESITIYDPQTRWLLTGDTLYPGYIYVKHWENYKKSIARLELFSESNDVTALMGSHIEMTRTPEKYYPIGTTFQPDEAPLDLRPGSLKELNDRLQGSNGKEELVFDGFIVAPMNGIQRTLSNIARWITQ